MSPPPSTNISLTSDMKEIRFIELQKLFVDKFKCEPKYFVRVPGRVNLIGEHIDYCGYSVCPMAIQQDILIAVCESNDFSISLTNTDPNHKDFSCDIRTFSILEEGSSPPGWYSYVLCGVRGVLESLTSEKHIPVGFLAAVTGNIPLASGLSSSSALVCSAALATALVNKVQFTFDQLAVVCAQSERYIGTQGGGMDQAIAFLATAGSAKHIEFDPLRTTEIQLPSDAVFVIAHSLHSLNKAATSDFNQRVAECRLAGQIIAKKKGLTWRKINKLADLQVSLKLTLAEMEDIVAETLHEHPYTKEEVCQALEVTEQELEHTSLNPKVKHVKTFKLFQRALHVFREGDKSNALEQLGQLMQASHQSLAKLYECSHPQLDQLIEVASKYALGCRLTGAGWGGCTVSLATKATAPTLVDLLKEEFYLKNPMYKGQDLNTLVFITKPGSGCRIYDIEEMD
ncbi:N-acetylgalactosamine kinase [Gryllus bimaculatus]|nr:N-acetylgalactosamine kinase [Gryllus bimaculatus]